MKVVPFIALFSVVFGARASSQDPQVPLAGNYVGVAESPDLQSARSTALSNLVQQIQVFVSSAVKRTAMEEDEKFSDSYVSSTIARSFLSLRDVQEKVEETGEGYQVTKFVSRDIVREIFAQRRARILDLLRGAQWELSGDGGSGINLGSALKQFYWALLLTEIHPDTITFAYEGLPQTIGVQVPQIVESIIRQISFRPVKQIDDPLTVWKCAATYNGKPISHLRYEYFDGVGVTDNDVANGETKVTLLFMDRLKREREVLLSIDYRYQDEMDELLLLADSMRSARALANTVVMKFPGSPSITKRSATATDAGGAVPNSLLPLLKAGVDFQDFIKILNDLARRKKIVFGSSNDFESLEGLYAAVVSREGLVALLISRKGKYFTVGADTEVDMNAYAGKQVVWMEVLR